MNKQYTAVVIGCGSIGALKEDKYDSPEEPAKGASLSILTHAHAYYDHPRIDLLGFVDSDIDKRLSAATKWNALSCEDITGFSSPDIISVCTPTESTLL